MQQIAAMLAVVLLVAGCTNPTTSRYSAGDVGQIIETSEGAVLTSRIVDVKGGENSNVGTIGGAAVGATAGYAVAGGGTAGGLVTVLGGLLGAGIGYLTEESVRNREGIEYVIRMSDGRVVTLVQNRDGEEEPLPNGAPVLVQYGGDYTRVIEMPQGVDGTPAGGRAPANKWENPDAPLPEQAPASPGQAGDSAAPQSQETQ